MGKKSKRNKTSLPKAAPTRGAAAAAAPTATAAAASAAPAAATSSTKAKNFADNHGGGKGKQSSMRSSAGRLTSAPDEITRMMSRLGFRNPFTATTRSEIDLITTPPVVSSDEHDPVRAPDGAACWICLEGPADGNAEPLRRNCACRGEDGFAHLTCLSSFSTTRSEDIWTGTIKPRPDSNQLAFGWAWESCHNCKQYFSGRLRLDLAREYARSTEGMVGGDREFRHIVARSWVTKSMMDTYNCCYAENYEMIKPEFDQLLDLIKKSYHTYEGDELDVARFLLRTYLKQTEGEVLTNYSQAVATRLRMQVSEERSISRGQRELYNKWHTLSTASLELFQALASGSLGKDLEKTLLQARTQIDFFNKEFAHLAPNKKTDGILKDEKEAIRLSEKLMNAYIKEQGELSTDAIRFSVMHAQKLMTAPPEIWRPFEALDLLLKTLKKSNLSLGPSHQLTKDTRYNLGRLITLNRKVANKLDPGREYCPVDSYEDDCDIYIVDTRGLEGRKTGSGDIGDEWGWDPSEVILHRGALVRCIDLVKADHLNGKRAWVEEYDEKTGRHRVNFEDESIKSCLVKSDNLRLLFFEEEDEVAIEEDEESGGKESSSDVDSTQADDCQDEDDMPDLY